MSVETDTTVQLRVETMEPAEFTSSHTKKHYFLELAVNIERAAAENLRNLAAIIIQDGAAGANMTEQGKATMLIKARQVPCRLLRIYLSLL